MITDEQYLRALNYPEDAWALSDQQWYTVAEIAAKLAMSAGGIRNMAERDEFPGAIQYAEKRIGWRIPRSGVIAFIATQRRATSQRRVDAQSVAEEDAS